MTSKPPSPKLAKSTALSKAQATVARLTALVPTMTTVLSPVTVYQPGGTVGGELATATGGLGVPGTTPVQNFYGVWVAPDVTGTGADYYAQIECFGAGGGGGGGSSAIGGGGGGGGEYACETQYPIVPGNSYAYVVGLPGAGGVNDTGGGADSSGTTGGTTTFDIAGLGLATGVVANGGLGGDSTSVGIGGAGGDGSSNSIHFPGGAGGTNNSDNGADNPVSFSEVPTGFFTLNEGNIEAWYVLNDASGTRVNDDSGNAALGVITNYSGGWKDSAATAPAQVPAYAGAAAPPSQPNATTSGKAGRFSLGSLTSASAKITCQAFPFSGTDLTVSCWLQCDPSGTWGNTAAGSYAVIAANTKNYDGNAMKGYALFLVNQGTTASPNWVLTAAVGNGTSQTKVATSLGAPSPGTWYYVVMTYAAGTLSLYLNAALEGTASSSGYTSVPSGAYATTLGTDPGVVANWFFGYMSNVWFAQDCATPTLVSQAYGLTPATGGSGGGASGGPSAAGGGGLSGSGATGGHGGTPPARPASLATTATPGMGGFAGAVGGEGNASPATPGGSVYGGGGGGSGSGEGGVGEVVMPEVPDLPDAIKYKYRRRMTSA
jgi:hypothetical protein